MPERMRLIRNRAAVIFYEEINGRTTHPSAIATPTGNEGLIPLDLRQHYHDLAEQELRAEGKIQ